MVSTSTISIHAVQVPNPNAMKFEVPNLLLSRDPYEFPDEKAAQASPLAAKLFGFDYVDRVFIFGNFITVHRRSEESVRWEEALRDLRIVIKKHLEQRAPLFTEGSSPLEFPEGKTDIEKQMKALIEDQILPATGQDGGLITFDSFEDGVVKVSLAGACVGCPFGPRTVKQGVETLLKRVFGEEVKEVTSEDIDWGETQQEATPGFDERKN